MAPGRQCHIKDHGGFIGKFGYPDKGNPLIEADNLILPRHNNGYFHVFYFQTLFWNWFSWKYNEKYVDTCVSGRPNVLQRIE